MKHGSFEDETLLKMEIFQLAMLVDPGGFAFYKVTHLPAKFNESPCDKVQQILVI